MSRFSTKFSFSLCAEQQSAEQTVFVFFFFSFRFVLIKMKSMQMCAARSSLRLMTCRANEQLIYCMGLSGIITGNYNDENVTGRMFSIVVEKFVEGTGMVAVQKVCGFCNIFSYDRKDRNFRFE